MRFRPLAPPVVTAILLLVASTGAGRADVIDGEWCDDSGHHFTISGPQIVTPQGTTTTGNCSRHAFSIPCRPATLRVEALSSCA